MTTYEKIKELLNMGFWVECENSPIDHTRETFFAEFEGYIIGRFHNLTEKDFTRQKYQITKIITRKPKMLPAGAKVRIAEDFKPYVSISCDVNKIKMIGNGEGVLGYEMLGYEIKSSSKESGSYSIYQADKKDYWDFPVWCVIPVYDDDDKKTEVLDKVKALEDNIEKLKKEVAELRRKAGEL